MPGGNLLCMNADLEAAQALGFGNSIISTNNSGYSSVPDNTTPEEILSYILKGCQTHVQHSLLNFKDTVSSNDFQHLRNFPYMVKYEADSFTKFIESLGNPRINVWWKHKLNYWDICASTMNIGEG
ncbi:hypothetical protein BDQ17DRAFT_1439575 [Cyathus striatus]|nr:hypothetical protein BDQ17DRAFT_1439575 [Cyathus striatus]